VKKWGGIMEEKKISSKKDRTQIFGPERTNWDKSENKISDEELDKIEQKIVQKFNPNKSKNNR